MTLTCRAQLRFGQLRGTFVQIHTLAWQLESGSLVDKLNLCLSALIPHLSIASCLSLPPRLRLANCLPDRACCRTIWHHGFLQVMCLCEKRSGDSKPWDWCNPCRGEVRG